MRDIITIRSSSWGDLLDCAARWEATYIDGKKMPLSAAAHMGTSIHHGSAVYDMARIEGRPASVDEAVQEAIERLKHPHEEVYWRSDDISKQKAAYLTVNATTAYCRQLSGQYDFKAVELRPSPLLIDVEGLTIEISGQMDRTRIAKGSTGIGIGDVKTGRQIVSSRGQAKTAGFKFQMGVYELLAEHSLDQEVTLPADILAVSTSDTTRTAVGHIHGAKDLMLGTEERPGIIETVGKMVKQGLFPPNPRSMLCGEKFCPIYHQCKAHD